MSKNALAVAVFLSLLCACSRTHTVTTRDGSVSVQEGKDGAGSVHAVGKDGTSVDINTGKPITDYPSYPSDAPLYAGKAVMDVNSGEKNARMVMVQTSDSLAKIADFYKTQLDSKGWKVDTSLNTDKMVIYKASKDKRDLVVQIGSDSGKEGTQVVSQTLADR